MSLNEKQQRFVQEYLVDLNATQAAIRAGYSAQTARQQASRLLSDDDISAAISNAQKEVAQKHGITVDRIVSELALLGFSNMQDYMRSTPGGDPFLDFSALTREQAAALTEVTVEDYTEGRGEDAREVKRVKFKLADKRAALVDLGKHLGMFQEKPMGGMNVTFMLQNGPAVIEGTFSEAGPLQIMGESDGS